MYLTKPNGKTVPLRPRDIYFVRNVSEGHIPYSDVTVREQTTGRTFRVREGIEQIKERTPGENWVYTTGEDGMAMYINFSAVTDHRRGMGPDHNLIELRFASACARYVRSSRELEEHLARESDSPAVA